MGKEKFILEYGVMSSRFRCTADNKLTAYIVALMHYGRNNFMVMLYEPRDVVENDQWFNPTGKIAKRLDEIFGGEGSVDKYVEEHSDEIREAFETIEQIC